MYAYIELFWNARIDASRLKRLVEIIELAASWHLQCVWWGKTVVLYKEVEDTKEVIRSRKSKNGRYSDRKKIKRQNTKTKTNDW
jgi:hypothetical protein